MMYSSDSQRSGLSMEYSNTKKTQHTVEKGNMVWTHWPLSPPLDSHMKTSGLFNIDMGQDLDVLGSAVDQFQSMISDLDLDGILFDVDDVERAQQQVAADHPYMKSADGSEVTPTEGASTSTEVVEVVEEEAKEVCSELDVVGMESLMDLDLFEALINQCADDDGTNVEVDAGRAPESVSGRRGPKKEARKEAGRKKRRYVPWKEEEKITNKYRDMRDKNNEATRGRRYAISL